MMLAEQSDYVQPSGGIANQTAFGLGYAPSGIDLKSYLDIPATHALAAIGRGMDVARALDMGLALLERMTSSMIDDTARSAAGVSVAQRQNVGYIRVEDPDCCARCMILAGKWYRWNDGFLRHPHCHGRHIPVKGKAQAERNGWITDPMDRFNRLDHDGQDRLLGPSSAQAVRDGADIYQVVNARRGVKTVAGGRRNVIHMTTTEGTTRYGWSRMLAQSQGRTQRFRLTPEGIYSLSRSRDEAIRLLRREGYIIAPDWRTKVPEIRRSMWLRNNNYRQGRHTDMTAAQKRLQTARLQYLSALNGVNPYGRGLPMSDEVMARAENNFRRWLSSDGQIYVD